MIKDLDVKPDIFKDEIYVDHAEYCEFCFEDNVPYGYLVLEWYEDSVVIHFTFLKWGPSTAKQAKKDLDSLKEIVKASGINKIVAYTKNQDDNKWPKFMKLMGFPEQNYKILQTTYMEF